MRAERIARLLPEVYQRTIVPGTPIATLLDVMDQLHGPVEAVLADLPDYFDPQLTPDRFVPFLARWVDLARWLDDTSGEFDSGVGRLRQVVAASAQLSRLRGTAEGLREALEWATGVAGVRIDEEVRDAAGRRRPFHVVVTLPKDAVAHRPLVERIVAQEKPAHVTAEVVFEDGPASASSSASPPEPETPADKPPVLPVGGPAAPAEPSFPGSEPAPVLTAVPEPPAPPPPVPPGTAPAAPVLAAPVPAAPAPAAPAAPAPAPAAPAPAPTAPAPAPPPPVPPAPETGEHTT
ncbi:phage tail protein [Microbacterium sp. B2969]|uniref:Phage tail protein n=1 Tax=Microbacterium alkaliflavum TaxID=3248839 RepID=A0ABW7Q941_9MICO